MTRRQRGRIARQGAARHSETLSKSVTGEPRDRRRSAQGLTDSDLDPEFLKIENGRITSAAKDEVVATVLLTDQSAGTPTNAVPAVADLAAAPASATALRDELVSTTLPAIRDALATLASAVNSILKAR